jgi:hypothetical protein
MARDIAWWLHPTVSVSTSLTVGPRSNKVACNEHYQFNSCTETEFRAIVLRRGCSASRAMWGKDY